MTSKKVLLGTTALLGAGVIMASGQALAADFDINLSGFSRFDAYGGDVDGFSDVNNNRKAGFQTDSEVHVNVTAIDEETGIEYGARIEFETDTNQTTNTDEMWIFTKGGWGEFRFGSEDGPTDNMRIGGQSIAAGTGGIDGANSVGVVANQTANSGDANKIIYYSPVFAGFQLGLSYAHDSNGGNGLVQSNVDALHKWTEGGVTYDNSFGAVDLRLSVTANAAEGNGDGDADDDYWGGNIGGIVGIAGIDFALGAFTGQDIPGQGDVDGVTGGVAAALGPANVSITAGYNDTENDGNPRQVVFSGDVPLLPGLALQGDLNFFDRDSNDNNADDDGVTGVVRLALSY